MGKSVRRSAAVEKRTRASAKEVHRIDAALAALGNLSV